MQGDVAMFVPIAWQVLGYFLFAAVAAGCVFLCLARYGRVVSVPGEIQPAAGIAPILPARAGVIAAVTVREGQVVAPGTLLARLRTEEDGIGTTTALRVARAIEREAGGIEAQRVANESAAAAQAARVEAERAGLVAEIAQIDSQIRLQRILIAAAKTDLDRARAIATRGFVSGRDLQVREETLLAREQQSAQLRQTRAAKLAAITAAQRNADAISAQARAQAAGLAGARAEVAQRAAGAEGARGYALRAPIGGRIAALTARIGQTATGQEPLMTIVPLHSPLRAQLAVPAQAIGMVREGETVRVAVDAFPYQRFGTIDGRVIAVAGSAVLRGGQGAPPMPVYPVTVALQSGSVRAYGRSFPLVSGMTASARIVTQRQTLVEWLFDPLFAVARR